ncbi:hypothetical protein BOTCAL_0155g00100 [Botryotinia calthae]|uniref:Uncharacterized protein n=1 Tax=Botryotinia calthae TaxID=38488 RepID=A0A4Y8D4S1_9HELO|nr:hypothetical protein BOTCAL_0155g00100 [Botryotinia calthae]
MHQACHGDIARLVGAGLQPIPHPNPRKLRVQNSALRFWKCAELTGEVTDGWLTICGPLGKALIRFPAEYFGKGSSENIRLAVDENDYYGTHFPIDFLLEVKTVQIEEGGLEEEIVQSSERPDEPNSSKISEVSLDVWCLKICQVDQRGMKGMVLVLGKSERQKGRYERLGLGEINSEKSRRAFAASAVNVTITIV